MKNLKFLVAAAMVMASTTAFAQFANSGSGNNSSSDDIVKSYNRVAVSYNSYKFAVDVKGADDNTLNGIGAEWIHGFSLSSTSPLYLETGLKFMYGFKSDEESYVDEDDHYIITETTTTKYTTMNLSVPINIAYRFTFSGNSNLAITPFTGITLKGNLSMKEKVETESEEYIIYYDEYAYDSEKTETDWFDKKDVGKDTAKRFQFGWQIGAGLSYKALYVGLSYGLDFSEFQKKVKTSNFALTLGYNF